jgi:Zn-dependent peptidase ImmA (M78 family)
MTVRIPVKGTLLAWAVERSRIAPDELSIRFPALGAWREGTKQPTLKQLEKFAQATHTPVGYLFLSEPPDEHLPVPDFRTVGDVRIGEASPDLLDTIYQCQQRQDWYRDFARLHREEPVSFIGTLTTDSDAVEAARQMQETFDFDVADRGHTWSEALSNLIDRADKSKVLIMVNGVVGSNTHRKLDPHEFRGFALVDDVAPLVFVNGADTKAAQIFTLSHELAHLWLGQSGVSDADLEDGSTNVSEQWCNEVAAEFLVPLEMVRGIDVNHSDLTGQIQALARVYKVSTLVVLRRLYDVGNLSQSQFRRAYGAERDRILAFIEESGGGGGGNFYNTQPIRVGKRFARALIESTLEGQTLHRDAYQMLGFKKHSTFEELARHLGVV